MRPVAPHLPAASPRGSWQGLGSCIRFRLCPSGEEPAWLSPSTRNCLAPGRRRWEEPRGLCRVSRGQRWADMGGKSSQAPTCTSRQPSSSCFSWLCVRGGFPPASGTKKLHRKRSRSSSSVPTPSCPLRRIVRVVHGDLAEICGPRGEEVTANQGIELRGLDLTPQETSKWKEASRALGLHRWTVPPRVSLLPQQDGAGSVQGQQS